MKARHKPARHAGGSRWRVVKLTRCTWCAGKGRRQDLLYPSQVGIPACADCGTTHLHLVDPCGACGGTGRRAPLSGPNW